MSEHLFEGCPIDATLAENMLNKTVLVTLNCMNEFDDLQAVEQFHGKIVRINHDEGLVVLRDDNAEEFNLPPELEHYQVAKPGRYQLVESDVEIENPDFIVDWTIYPPSD